MSLSNAICASVYKYVDDGSLEVAWKRVREGFKLLYQRRAGPHTPKGVVLYTWFSNWKKWSRQFHFYGECPSQFALQTLAPAQNCSTESYDESEKSIES